MSDFDFKLKPKRALWKEVAIFCATVFGVWGGTHLFLNYDAFAQIAKFKAETLKASVVETFTSGKKVEKTEVALGKIKRKRSKFRNKSLKPRTQAKDLFANMPVYPSDNRLFVPRINKNVPLVEVPSHRNWNQLETNIQGGLRDGVVVHPVSHEPGAYGNFFVTGHSSYYKWDPGRFKDVFALLHEVKEGDVIDIYWEGQKFEYQIHTKKVIPPTEISVLNQPVDQSIITLMTCTPVGTNKNRLILVGDLKE